MPCKHTAVLLIHRIFRLKTDFDVRNRIY